MAVPVSDRSDADASARDHVWIERVRAGDEQALAQLIYAYAEPLRNYLYWTVWSYDVAEDIVQNLWIWLWERRGELRVNGSVRSYLYRAAHNRALNAIRDNRTYDRMVGSALDIVEQSVSDGATDAHVEAVSTREVLNAVISEFRPPMREICMLRFEQDLSYAEIAEVLGISEVNVRMAVSRATRRLVERLREVL